MKASLTRAGMPSTWMGKAWGRPVSRSPSTRRRASPKGSIGWRRSSAAISVRAISAEVLGASRGRASGLVEEGSVSRVDRVALVLWLLALGNLANGLWMLADPTGWYGGIPAAVPDTG